MPTRAFISVPALCEFTHEGRLYVRGEMVRVSPVVALRLFRDGKVTLSKPGVEVPVSNRYRRRDMRAER